MMGSEPQILIVGHGYGGMNTARGFPDWMSHRTYHLLMLPTMNPRLRVDADWTLALLSPPAVVPRDVLERQRQDFQAALDVVTHGPSRTAPFQGGRVREAERHAYHQ
jgi:hypothetical protein